MTYVFDYKVRSEVACQLLGFMPNDNYTEEDFEDELAKFFKNEDVSVILFPPPFSKLDKELLTPVISDSLLARLVLFLRCDQPAEPLLSPKLQKVAFLDRPDEALERRAMLINNRFTRS